MANERKMAASSQANSTRSLVASLRKFWLENIIATVIITANMITIKSRIKHISCCLNLSDCRYLTFFFSNLTMRWLSKMAIPR